MKNEVIGRRWNLFYLSLHSLNIDVNFKPNDYAKGDIQIIRDTLDQWFSTFGSWRPTKHKNTQFGDPHITIVVL